MRIMSLKSHWKCLTFKRPKLRAGNRNEHYGNKKLIFYCARSNVSQAQYSPKIIDLNIGEWRYIKPPYFVFFLGFTTWPEFMFFHIWCRPMKWVPILYVVKMYENFIFRIKGREAVRKAKTISLLEIFPNLSKTLIRIRFLFKGQNIK